MTSESISEHARDPEVVPPAEAEQQRIRASPSPAVDTLLQQGDGNEVPADESKKPSEVNQDAQETNVAEQPPHSPTFKEQVYGYARLIRGTVLGQPDVKEQGAQVLRGEQGIPLQDTRREK